VRDCDNINLLKYLQFFIMLKHFNSLMLALFVFSFPFFVTAVEVKDLYQASVVIQTQNSSDRASALKKALAVVMLKVGGEESVLNNPEIKKALANHHFYLNKYRYQQKTRQLNNRQDIKTLEKQLFLLASFNEQKVNLLFQKANLPLWGSLRPQVILWLVEEQDFKRSIISNPTDSNISQQIIDFAEQRGLPIVIPLMDLTDSSKITISDIWGGFEQPIQKASNRYLAEAIVVMRLSNSSLVDQHIINKFKRNNNVVKNCELPCTQSKIENQPYVLDLRLTTQNQKLSKRYHGVSRQKLLNEGLADVTELIFQYYALTGDSNNELIIDVANVDSLTTYVDVFAFLTDLSSVQNVTLVQANGESRQFKLLLKGSKKTFLSSLKLSKWLVAFVDHSVDIHDEQESELPPLFYWIK